MKTDYLEITLPERSDPFDKLIKLKKQGKVLRANMVNGNVMGIVFDSEKITEQELKTIIGIRESNGETLKEIINGTI